jgi:hypothetical protein
MRLRRASGHNAEHRGHDVEHVVQPGARPESTSRRVRHGAAAQGHVVNTAPISWMADPAATNEESVAGARMGFIQLDRNRKRTDVPAIRWVRSHRNAMLA